MVVSILSSGQFQDVYFQSATSRIPNWGSALQFGSSNSLVHSQLCSLVSSDNLYSSHWWLPQYRSHSPIACHETTGTSDHGLQCTLSQVAMVWWQKGHSRPCSPIWTSRSRTVNTMLAECLRACQLTHMGELAMVCSASYCVWSMSSWRQPL